MVYSISRSLPTPASRPPPAHYQTYLTPILHRRFARSCFWVMAACYVEAILLGDKSTFLWNLLPITWTSVRCALLFALAAMPLLVLRISQLHITSSLNPSVFHAVRKSLGSFATYSAIITYMASCIVITTLYLWSAKPKDVLGFVSEGRSYERPRLNERFLYLSFLACYAGFAQGINHTCRDRGKLDLSDSSRTPKETIEIGLPKALANTISMSAFIALTGAFVYIPARSFIWENTLMVARTIYWLNRSTALPSYPVGPGLFARSAVLTFMMCALPEVCHLVFAAHFAQSPFQSGKVVTDKSSDPNGTLLTGLRSTKGPLVQTIAFSELAHIAQERPDRRQLIFTDVDRKPNMWEQVLSDCLAVLSDVEVRLSDVMAPSKSALSVAHGATYISSALASPPSITRNPENVLITSPKASGQRFIESVQSTEFTSSGAEFRRRLPISPPATTSKDSMTIKAKEQFLPFLSSSYGKPFRQTIQSTTSSLIPNVHLQINAIRALALLTCASIKEDQYGLVQKRIATILESFYTTLSILERYTSDPPIHWTDVESRNSAKPVLKEPELLIRELKSAIRSIVDIFGSFEVIPQSLRNKLPTE